MKEEPLLSSEEESGAEENGEEEDDLAGFNNNHTNKMAPKRKMAASTNGGKTSKRGIFESSKSQSSSRFGYFHIFVKLRKEIHACFIVVYIAKFQSLFFTSSVSPDP